jgi:hypothetical protein
MKVDNHQGNGADRNVKKVGSGRGMSRNGSQEGQEENERIQE